VEQAEAHYYYCRDGVRAIHLIRVIRGRLTSCGLVVSKVDEHEYAKILQ
jgi:hypothetical protein